MAIQTDVLEKISHLEKRYNEVCHPISAFPCIRGREIKNITLEECNELIEKSQTSDNFFLRGMVHFFTADYRYAIADFDRAIDLNPTTDAHDYKVKAAFKLGDAHDIARSLDDLIISKISLLENEENEENIEFYDNDIYYSEAFSILIELYILLDKYKNIETIIDNCFFFIKENKNLFISIVYKYGIAVEEKKLSIEDLKNERNRNKKLVDRYSHTLSNTIFPKTLYNIADKIKDNIHLKKDAILLYDAYHAEIDIILENELLQKRYCAKNQEGLRQSIRGARLPVTDPSARGIKEILDYSLSRVITRILNQGHAKLDTVRKSIEKRTKRTINDLRKDFEDSIFFSDQLKTSIEWCNENLCSIEINFLSKLWESVAIRHQSLSEQMLYGHFSEILFNAFKYSDYKSNWFLKVNFDELSDGETQYLVVIWENPVPSKNISSSGGRQGLAAIAEDIHELNEKTTPENSLHCEVIKGKFRLKLFYRSDLLIFQQNKKIDLGMLFDKKIKRSG